MFRKLGIVLVVLSIIFLTSSCNSITINTKFDSEMFIGNSTEYSKQLAQLSAKLSKDAENKTDENIKNTYKNCGIDNCETFRYGESGGAFAIGMNSVDINGAKTIIIVLTARGSQTISEFVGDVQKGNIIDGRWIESLDTRICQNVYEFYQQIMEGFGQYINRDELYLADDVKILITGHSLGGAAANVFAAKLTYDVVKGNGWWNGKLGKEDIYCYTFGAITTIDSIKNIEEGYENIHNIYNYYDSFGPNGVHSAFNASEIEAKFGHTELFGNFSEWYNKYKEIPGVITVCKHHDMDTYIDAISNPSVSKLLTCADTHEQEIEICEDDTKNIQEPQISSEKSQPECQTNDFNLIGSWDIGNGGYIEFKGNGDCIFDWGSQLYGYKEKGTYKIGETTGSNSFKIMVNGTSILKIMSVLNGSITKSYHFEILKKDNDNIYLVQVYGDYTAETSPCKLPLKRIV